MSHFIEVHVKTEGEKMKWSPGKYSKQESEVLSFHPVKTIELLWGSASDAQASERVWNIFEHVDGAWHVVLLPVCPWGFSDQNICNVNLTWQGECSVVNKNVWSFLFSRGREQLFPLKHLQSGSTTFTSVLNLNWTVFFVCFLIRRHAG